MCDPFTATTLIVASTALSAGTAIYAGYQQRGMAKYQAAVDRNNATYADRQAADALERGQEEVEAHYRQLAALRGDQRAGFAAAGLDTSFGSPLEILTDSSVLGNEDAERLAENASREAQGFRISAQNSRASATAHEAEGRNAVTQGWLNAGGDILSGATKLNGYKAKYGTSSRGGSSSGMPAMAYGGERI